MTKLVHFMIDISREPQITDYAPKSYIESMKRCWDHDPKNRPTANGIKYRIKEHHFFKVIKEKQEIIRLAETKRQEIINSDKFLSDTKNYESFYITRLLYESI
nr:11008_t:CDS:2 [Entrophospora candida]